MKRKIAVVVTARPSYARIKSVLRAIEEHPSLELQLVMAGSALLERYGRVIDVAERDGFKPAAIAHMVVEGESPLTSAKTLGLGVIELAGIFDRLKPDCVVTVADRYETLATAVAASYQNIPLAHVQGGEITGSIDEKVRHAVTKLADLHFVANEQAFDRVVKMGEPSNGVQITGCPSIDLCRDVKALGDDSDLRDEVRQECARGSGAYIDPFHRDFIIAMQHPVTYEWDAAGDQVLQTLRAVEKTAMSCFWFWPNIDAGADLTSKTIRLFRERERPRHIRFLRNMAPEPFLWLLNNARCIVGNSSAGIREASYFGTPAIDIGTRQSGRDKGPNVVPAEHDETDIVDMINGTVKDVSKYQESPLYGDGAAGPRIAHLLAETPLTTEKKLAFPLDLNGDTGARGFQAHSG